MKDSVDFNIEFIAEIEKNPELYDYSLDNYSNKRITEVLWAKIGAKFNEKGDDCRNKWKSIRSAYIRSLNTKSKTGSGAGSKREYYLAKYLQFLIPFTKSRRQEGNIPSQSQNVIATNEHEPSEIDYLASEESQQLSNLEADEIAEDENHPRQEIQTPLVDVNVLSPCSSSTANSSSTKTSRRRPISDADKCAIDYFSLKKRKLENKLQTESQKSSCELFLLSLVPHMESMTQQQQLSFQRKILELLENIKYPQHQNAPSAATFYTHFSQQVMPETQPQQELTRSSNSQPQSYESSCDFVDL